MVFIMKGMSCIQSKGLFTLKVHLYYSESDVAPDRIIENAIEC